jgi:hypothetical protein
VHAEKVVSGKQGGIMKDEEEKGLGIKCQWSLHKDVE